MTPQDAIACATKELVAPRLPGTRNLLKLHAESIDASDLQVAYVGTGHLPEFALVYFRMSGKPYHMMVAVASEEVVEAYGVSIEPSVRVLFKIRSLTVTPDEITRCLSVTPTRTYDPSSSVHPRPGVLQKMYEWVFEPQKKIPGSVEEKLGFLLDSLVEAGPRIRSLQDCCELRVSVVYHGWSGNAQFGGWYIAPRQLHQISEFGADLEFDLYATGPAGDEDQGDESIDSIVDP